MRRPFWMALAAASPDHNEHRQDEPYRRALSGMYARLAATLHVLTGTEALRHAVAPESAGELGRSETRFFLLAAVVLLAFAALTNLDAVLAQVSSHGHS